MDFRQFSWIFTCFALIFMAFHLFLQLFVHLKVKR